MHEDYVNTQEDDVILSKRELAVRLGVAVRTIDVWMRNKQVPFFKINRTVRFSLREVLKATRVGTSV